MAIQATVQHHAPSDHAIITSHVICEGELVVRGFSGVVTTLRRIRREDVKWSCCDSYRVESLVEYIHRSTPWHACWCVPIYSTPVIWTTTTTITTTAVAATAFGITVAITISSEASIRIMPVSRSLRKPPAMIRRRPSNRGEDACLAESYDRMNSPGIFGADHPVLSGRTSGPGSSPCPPRPTDNLSETFRGRRAEVAAGRCYLGSSIGPAQPDSHLAVCVLHFPAGCSASGLLVSHPP